MANEVDLGQSPVLYPEGFTRAMAERNNGDLDTAAAEGGQEDVPSALAGEKQPEYYCGCGPWHPRWLQVFRDGRVFTVFLCLFSTIEGALVSGFTSVVLSSLERRYRLPSTATGAVASTFDVAVLVSVVFISYFSERGHKPRWLGASLIIQATGALIFALPQFVFGPYRVGTTASLELEACLEDEDFSSECSSANGFALAFFIVGNILIGVGAAPLFTVGTSYLDEIIHPDRVPIHLGIFYMLTIIGPAIGYALGGLFLSIYVDPWEETRLDTSDPGWVGAWWLSFLFCAITSFLLAIPFFMFPRLFPDSATIRELRRKEMPQGSKGKHSVGEDKDLAAVIKTFPLHVWHVFSTLSWLFITIAICVSFVVVSGFASFGPKYVESLFGLSASLSSIAIGAVAIPTGGTGVLVGGIIIYCLKLKGHRVVLMNLIITCLAFFPLLGLLVHCPAFDLVGVSTAYPDGINHLPDTASLNASCFARCNCSSSVFEPVCGADGQTYFSPCSAGCDKRGGGEDSAFENCTCIAQHLLFPNSSFSSSSSSSSSSSYLDLLSSNSTASDGLCPLDCSWELPLFLALIGLSLFFIFMLQVPNLLITIRSVGEEHRTLALGLQSFMFRLFGTIPGPIIFGVIFDSTCIFWQEDCGRRGNCWLYDNTALSTRAVILATMAMLGNAIFSFLSWVSWPRQKTGEKEREEGEQGEGGVCDNNIGNEGEGDGEEEEEDGDETGRTSVIARLQTYNSTSRLVEEVGFNRKPSITSTSL